MFVTVKVFLKDIVIVMVKYWMNVVFVEDLVYNYLSVIVKDIIMIVLEHVAVKLELMNVVNVMVQVFYQVNVIVLEMN